MKHFGYLTGYIISYSMQYAAVEKKLSLATKFIRLIHNHYKI